VSPQRLAGRLAEPGDDVEDAVGDASFGGELGEADGAQRGELGRLDDEAVAGSERGGRLPGRHHDREVPRQDGTDDPDRLADDHPQGITAGRRDRVVQLVGRLGIPAERLDRLGQVRLATIRDRLARLERIEQGQLLGIRLDHVGQTKEDGLALGRGASRPAAVVEGSTGGRDGEVDVRGLAGGDVGQDLAGGRILGREALTIRRGTERAIDERIGPKGRGRGDGHSVSSRCSDHGLGRQG
jgi:hypothetical protein